MAKNEPNKPDDTKTAPATETPKEKAAPVSEPLTTDKQPEAPEIAADKAATLPGPGDDVVVSFDKINEIISEKKAAKAQEAGQPAPDKQPKPEKAPKAEKTAKAPKAAGKQAPAKAEAPAPEQEKPPEPREAPRSSEQEQIVYISLSELHPFKDHPFQVRKDEEMAAMVESVKDKGVTQAPARIALLGLYVLAGHGLCRHMLPGFVFHNFGPTWPEVAGFGATDALLAV